MAKRVDPMKAKAAKQKKIAIGGSVLLLALLGIQGPKTLKMLQGPQPIAQPTPAATTGTDPATGTPAPAGTETTGGTAAGAAPAATADLAAVANSDPAPEAEQGQLATFERFESKDPFAQQATAPPAPPAAPRIEPGSTTTLPGSASPPPAEGAEGSAAGGTDGGFTTTPSPPSAPAPRPVAEETSIAVNGTAEKVELEAAFPAAEPTFVLVSIAKDGKSVQIGIAGGQYADGGSTIKLALGKKLTLQNTADGSRYELELRSIEGFPLPKKG